LFVFQKTLARSTHNTLVPARVWWNDGGPAAAAAAAASVKGKQNTQRQHTKMPTYNIEGIDVDFPHQAYPCQVSGVCMLAPLLLLCIHIIVMMMFNTVLIYHPLKTQIEYMRKVILALEQARWFMCVVCDWAWSWE
jgi:hypothetical protein